MPRLLAALGGILLAGVLLAAVVVVSWKPTRKRLFFSMAVPHGRIGRVLARTIPNFHRPIYPQVASALQLRPDDDLLEVACGSGEFLEMHASRVGHVTGIDLSDVHVELARERLDDRIATGTAEIVRADAAALPFPGERFSAVTCMGSLEFFDAPQSAIREMCRVLRPGGRLVLTVGWREDDQKVSGSTDAFGLWTWHESDVRRMLEDAGFTDVTISYGPWGGQEARLVRGVRPA